ncbi:MAG: acetate--CoA ligase family protein [Alphaproteobacteria bacterium]|jgi:acyl-CoA synthetase (NDP forming)|nr:acetate--CoA ligase family protein [Alphaproteobacteria bacterium]
MSKPDLGRALLAPASIALVGASADVAKTTSRPQRYLRRHGFAGPLYPINPGREEVFGEPAYASPEAMPDGVEHVHIMLPTERVIETVRACGERGVACASILAGGFAEAGADGLTRQRELLEAASTSGMRLLGPNCIGVINASDGIAISANAVLEIDHLLPGRTGLVSQSGSLIGAILSRGQARGFGFSKLVSVGNEADLKLGEVADLLVDDDATRIILLFLETIRDAGRIAAMAARAHAAGKPVIAYKLGRSELGAELATSHTGALAGNDAAVDAFLDDVGILRIDTFEALLETGALAVCAPARKAPATRVAVLTTSGGGGAMVVDQLGLRGIDVPAPPDGLRRELAANGIEIGPDRLIDVTLAGARPEVYGAILAALLDSGHTDAVVAVVGSSAQFHAELAVAPILETRQRQKPLAVFLTPEADASLALLAEADIAAFRTPESCADALAAVLRRRTPAGAERPPIGDTGAAAALLADGAANEHAALTIFESLGVPRGPAAVLDLPVTPEQVAAIDFFPVAVKALSADLAHKTEAGGVTLGVNDAAELAFVCQHIVKTMAASQPEVRLDGLLVQAMESGVAEVLIGYKRDPLIGPLAVVGSGGTMAEVYDDVAVRRAPVSLETAREMIESLQGAALLKGFRGAPAADIDALAGALAALSDLARLPDAGVLEAEINPLIVKPAGEGVVAVDGLIVNASLEGEPS